ncbi:hypothetical protein ANCDUO_12066 [Ancylostoma duodenale]|uniref:Rhodanese domain-containing protein n=1 Tax=Ancylostoma duodenale TaxID=51022 RepID=A0A0C2GFR6_9BILA|nr:hypothetical protein ANCDUO_12066 [Ancylostoma duodenale]
MAFFGGAWRLSVDIKRLEHFAQINTIIIMKTITALIAVNVNIPGLTLHGFKPDRPTVILCNLGVQASMLAYAIETVFPHNPIQVYSGSLKEMAMRNPNRISAITENV